MLRGGSGGVGYPQGTFLVCWGHPVGSLGGPGSPSVCLGVLGAPQLVVQESQDHQGMVWGGGRDP